MSVAFGAPMGGALFFFELVKPNPYWKFSMLWKTFLSCGTAVATMAMAEGIVHGKFTKWTAASLKFGNIRVASITPSAVVPGAIILGFVSGLLGPLFVNINTRVNAYRARILTKNYQKLIDTFIFAFITSTFWYWVPYYLQSCVSKTILTKELAFELKEASDTVLDSEEEINVYRAWC